ncbi:hypothetical protein [Nitrososphaera viennensis]|uniref:Uncharacterized protein n=1 Tax=Nitrososphaera viennensis TaxID=1034015 RepID=A0A977IFA3_9ARCH|nr:hypothetical protein [Nitrososphaera viennensis]UVS69702.1 hypothetical protein NWT39_02685 [Nitrososphaera viennensis]
MEERRDSQEAIPVVIGLTVGAAFVVIFGLMLFGNMANSAISSKEADESYRRLPSHTTFVGVCGSPLYSSNSANPVTIKRGEETPVQLCAWSSASVPKKLHLLIIPSEDFPHSDDLYARFDQENLFLTPYHGEGANENLMTNGGRGSTAGTNLHLRVDKDMGPVPKELKLEVIGDSSVEVYPIFVKVI